MYNKINKKEFYFLILTMQDIKKVSSSRLIFFVNRLPNSINNKKSINFFKQDNKKRFFFSSIYIINDVFAQKNAYLQYANDIAISDYD